jgi:hypothetical protein
VVLDFIFSRQSAVVSHQPGAASNLGWTPRRSTEF